MNKMDYISRLILPGVISTIIGYLLGSISFSILLTRIYKKEDIRKYGSGNAGATNVLRSVGKLPAALTFILDFLKCALSVTIGYLILSYASKQIGASETMAQIGKYAGGIGCILGHIFPVYFGFKGGKGVATSAALIALVDWRVFIPVFSVFIIAMIIKKIVSLGSIAAAISYPVFTFLVVFLFDYVNSPINSNGTMSGAYLVCVSLAACIISGIIIFSHRSNLKRLISGEEKPPIQKAEK